MDILKTTVELMLENSGLLSVDEQTGIIDFTDEGLKRLTDGLTAEQIFSEESDVLGHYTPMQSFGTVALHSRQLRSLFWNIVYKLRSAYHAPVMQEDLRGLAHMVAFVTYHHEYFHYYCDISRHLFQSAIYERKMEEALAVAYGYIKSVEERSKWQSLIGRMPSYIFRSSLIERFKYTASGYRDWPLYSDQNRFQDGLVKYINPRDVHFLVSSGVDVAYLLVNQLERVYNFTVKQEVL
jgi:hypothetical protein